MTRKVAAEQRGDHGAAEQRGDHGDTKKNDATESRRTEYSAAPHDHNVMNWGVMLMGGHGSDPVPSWKQAFPYTPLARKHAKSASQQELRKMIRARFDKALGTSRQLLTLVSTLTTDTWSSDKFRRMVDTSCVCIAAWMISILTTLSCVMLALYIVVVALYMILGLMTIWNWLTCRPTDEHLMNGYLKVMFELFIVVISLEFFCLAISSLCIIFSSI